MNRKKVEEIKKRYTSGTRVRLHEMYQEKQMPSGLCGTIDFVDDIGQIHIHWDNGSSLALNLDFDVFELI